MGTEEALRHFGHMCEDSVQPNDRFHRLLLVCTHDAGLVDEGMCYYIGPMITWTKGFLQHSNIMWQSQLYGNRIHGNVEIGKRPAKTLLEMEPDNAAGCNVLQSNIYAGAGNRHFCQSVERLRKGRIGVKKQLGCTWIEVNIEIKSILRTAEIVRADV
jgi:hypothetical protein